MRNLLLIILNFGVVPLAFGQDNAGMQRPQIDSLHYDELNLSIGAGLDHGGIGANICFYPDKSAGIFAGFGYAFAGLGVNGGLKYRFLSNREFSKLAPHLMVMYGYNAAIYVSNAQELSKLFYGLTLGAGMSFRMNPMKSNGLMFGLLVPIRSTEADAYIESLKKKGVVFRNELLPIGITFGYTTVLK